MPHVLFVAFLFSFFVINQKDKKDKDTLLDFKNKRVLVMGLGLHGGGVGTVRFLAKRGARVLVTDTRKKEDLLPSLQALANFSHVRYVLGKHREKDILSADLIVKNPGVPPRSPYIRLARKKHIPITTDMGIFFSLCPATIIGVTGTRGKSTTAFLIWKFLKTRLPRVFLAGNIRKSVLELLDGLKEKDTIVLELSSFQLHDLKSITHIKNQRSPHIAVLTNILRDHLNWHATMKEYQEAKRTIFANQTDKDYLFANGRDPIVREMAERAPSRVLFPELLVRFKKIVDANLGAHYESSVALAIGVAKHYGVSSESIQSALINFYGLEARQQEIATIRGVHYINDTTATVPDATVAAVLRFREKAKENKLILIAGGTDKKLDFKEMACALQKYVDCIVFLPGTGTEKLKKELQTVYKELDTHKRPIIYEAGSMREAVKTVSKNAQKGDWVVLSPGATSFGLFLNEFDRGDKFNDVIKSMRQTSEHKK